MNAQPPTPVAPTVAVAQPTCTVATGQITVTSSTVGMLFSLNGGAYVAYPVGGWTVAAGSNNTVSQQNAQGCNSPNAPANVNAQPATPVAPTLTVTQPDCAVAAGANGQVCVTAPLDGGGIDYEYSNNGGAYQDATCFTVTAGAAYSITARNKNGNCVSTPSAGTLGAAPTCTFDGCSPGFWKNHEELWDGINDNPILAQNMGAHPFITSTSFATFFGLSAQQMQAIGFPVNITMHGAISQGGGGCKAFARHAVSALLSSASGLSINYPSIPGGTPGNPVDTYDELYNVIRAALASGNCSGPLFSALEAISDDDHGNCGRFISTVRNNSRAFLEYVPVVSDKTTTPNNLTVTAYPNPYSDNVTFSIDSKVSGQAVLDVYNLTGQKIKTVFQGNLQAGKSQTIQFSVPAHNRTSLMYRLQVGDKVTTGKVLYRN